jgi:hypothetical protein
MDLSAIRSSLVPAPATGVQRKTHAASEARTFLVPGSTAPLPAAKRILAVTRCAASLIRTSRVPVATQAS